MSSSKSIVERESAVLHFCDFIEQSTLSMDFKELMKRAQILKVEISSSEKRWRVHLLLDALVKKQMLYQFAESIVQAIPALQHLEFKVKYSLPNISLADIVRDYWDEIIFVLGTIQPKLIGWLAMSNQKVSGNEMQIELPHSPADEFIDSKWIANQITDLISSEFNVAPRVTVLFSENLDQLSDDRNEQEYINSLLQQAIESQKQAPKDVTAKKENYHQGNKDNPFRRKKRSEPEPGAIKGSLIKEAPRMIQEITEEEKCVVVQGLITQIEKRQLKSGRFLIIFDITDLTDSLTIKFFEDEKDEGRFSGALNKGVCVKVRGPVQPDEYSRDKELQMLVWDICPAEFETRMDNAEEKRIELHLHTKMSSMDGVAGIDEIVKTAARWGHSAVAVTDHGVVQAFPEAYDAGKKHKVKIIYGIEGYLVNDGTPIVINENNLPIENQEYVVFDLETTGFSPNVCEIIEIGAVKINKGEIVDRFSTFVRPNKNIPLEIQELTGITTDMVDEAPTIEDIIPQFAAFIENCVLVAHNAQFDASFLRVNLNKVGLRLQNPVVDTLGLGRALLPGLKNHKLNTLAKELGVSLKNHHRAVDDAEATSHIFLKFLSSLAERELVNLDQINSLIKEISLDKLRTNHIILLVQNYTGLRNLYELVTLSHLKHYYRHPRIPRSELMKRREGILIGSACEAGELITAYLDGAEQKKLEEIAEFYDYLEIQPFGNNEFLIRQGRVDGYPGLQKLNEDIVNLGTKLNKPVVATGDVHFIEPTDGFYRQLLMVGQGYQDADQPSALYLKTTTEMLEEFSYLGADKAKEVVIDNPRLISEKIEEGIKPMPDDFFPPKIDGAEEQISSMTLEGAKSIYGDPLPEVVQKRVDKELHSIITNGFSVLYFIAHKLVKKSNEDGYLVGSRGSVGSSFVATMTGITEVNALPPHYICSNCKYSEFIQDGSYGCGADLPDKDCPKCGQKLKKDGFDIPFEVFLGFEGDKVPDIDLNFSGDYQPRAHKFTEELFGEGHVFRAGTIGTIAEKTAYGFVQKYLEGKGVTKRKAEIDRLVKGCTGVKRTTGQHPGGVMVIPRDMDVHDFTPLQYPADDKKSGVITTHFDYHSISGRIVKLDILGHDDPTVIKMLEDLTGVDAKKIPLDEPKVMSLFSGVDALGVTTEQIRSNVGTYAIPEFGTKFVRQMLEDTRPTTFSELVRISGFSHGTDVWLNNAQDLIKEGTCQLSEAISARDDIMIYLIYKGLEPRRSFKIMEGVRKGKGVTPEDEAYMLEKGVPEWYVASCKKIKYMFPKGHAVAYVMMAYRIAYFKVYYPEAFYTTYFSVRADEFDADIIAKGNAAVLEKLEDIETRLKGEGKNDVTTKEKNQLTILEVALEMYQRGIKMRRVNLTESQATKFLITDQGLLPPFASLQGLGITAALNIAKAREEKMFTSIEDLRNRAKLSKTVIEIMQNHGCLKDLPESAQLALF